MVGGGMNELKDRVTHMEEIVGTPQSGDANSLVAQVELQEIEIRGVQGELRDFIRDYAEQMNALRAELMVSVDKVAESVA
ncbi:hypothetical protein TorRG33x02_271870 [Trema orientale]|uniref:Uncharacterized protein n=1 Tax=Trema orientale TaxID=63057 RepID=A0A2P5CVA7_TREOI|nr:hypothetical protein TorRG33x02_271870 [Trema orientale]